MFFCIFLDICRVLILKRLYEQFDALKPRLLIIKGIQETFFLAAREIKRSLREIQITSFFH